MGLWSCGSCRLVSLVHFVRGVTWGEHVLYAALIARSLKVSAFAKFCPLFLFVREGSSLGCLKSCDCFAVLRSCYVCTTRFS